MLRFGKLLKDGLGQNGMTTHEIFPKCHLRRLTPAGAFSKWAGYADKYLFFPRKLASIMRRDTAPDLIHVLDHSNAVYLRDLNENRTRKLLTCHDLIALRCARNEFEDAPKTSKTGNRLQAWIHKSLPKADHFACDSSATLDDLNRLVPPSKDKAEVLHLGVDLLASDDPECQLSFEPEHTSYLLHVGSSSWYKNRKAVMDAFQSIKSEKEWNDLKLVLVGPPPQPAEMSAPFRKWLSENEEDILVVSSIPDATLQRLYEQAAALLFPSLVEGFGWPPLEARAAGCPVVASATGAIADLLGTNAAYVKPTNLAEIIRVTREVLSSKPKREKTLSIPSAEQCVKSYQSLYQRILHRN